MSDEEQDQAERAQLLAAWPADEPTAGFAERVAGAWQAEQRQPRPRRARWAVAAACVALVAGAIFAGTRVLPGGASSGTRVVGERESIALGNRGIAVAEAGAQLSWQVRGGDAQVTQKAGNVFYRVERGGPFVVHTDGGDVRVLGTCFRVEVDDMGMNKKGLLQMGAGAALATAVLVTVYEGKVLLANEHGKTQLVAGEQASSSSGMAPGAADATRAPIAQAVIAPPADGATRDELLKRDLAQRQELQQLRDKLKHLETAQADGSGKNDPDPKVFVAPTQDELQRLAKECRLTWDTPALGLNPATVSDRQANDWGLSDQERAEINRVNADTNAKVTAQLRQLYVEVTGDKAGGDVLTPRALEEEILAKSNQKDIKDAYYKLSHERAGLLKPPADLSSVPAVERMQRLMTGLGDGVEQDLAKSIGPERAHSLRTAHDGWGSKHGSSYGCPESN